MKIRDSLELGAMLFIFIYSVQSVHNEFVFALIDVWYISLSNNFLLIDSMNSKIHKLYLLMTDSLVSWNGFILSGSAKNLFPFFLLSG